MFLPCFPEPSVADSDIDVCFSQGTPLFWSPEVEKSKYIITRTDETHAFAHHYLHDGESIYWILKYILCSYAPKFLEGVTRKGLDDITSAQRKDLFRLYIPST